MAAAPGSPQGRMTALPLISTTLSDDSSSQITFTIPPDLCYFAGHFPGRPVVPAFVQLGWVLTFAQKKLNDRAEVAAIRAAKFLRPLLPAGNYRLEMQYENTRSELRFTIHDGNELCTSGKFLCKHRD